MRTIRKALIIISYCLLIIIHFGCSEIGNQHEVITIIDKKSNTIEKGITLSGKREGYWAIFDTNYVIKYDIQYRNNVPDGKTTIYRENSILIEAENNNGVRDGKFTSYHKYPIIEAQGLVKMGKRVGEWKLYTQKGELNKVIMYENDTLRVVLDNNLQLFDYDDE